MTKNLVRLAFAGMLLASTWLSAQSKQVLSPAPEFVPDTTFTGSALAGWQPLGDATWRATNGEIVGTWEQPAGGATQGLWTYHPVAFGRWGRSQSAGGVTFAELHALSIGDIDGDKIPDLVTGKRDWSHQDSYFDPDQYGEPVLYWYRTVRNPRASGGAAFVPELIHNRSGVGSQLVATDLNKDGLVDIMTSTNRGIPLFRQQAMTRPGLCPCSPSRTDPDTL